MMRLQIRDALQRGSHRRSQNDATPSATGVAAGNWPQTLLLEEDLHGNVEKLKGSRNEYRLRVGNYRVLFELEGRTATVYAVGDRKNIYR